jgi:NADH dehydrogenase FAD-containing subunit
MILDSKIPAGPLAEKWTKHKFSSKLVNPANKRKYDVIVVGTGLAGASAAASLAETLFTDYSTIPSRVEITVLVKATYTVLQKFR